MCSHIEADPGQLRDAAADAPAEFQSLRERVRRMRHLLVSYTGASGMLFANDHDAGRSGGSTKSPSQSPARCRRRFAACVSTSDDQYVKHCAPLGH